MDWLFYTLVVVLLVLGIVWWVQHRKQAALDAAKVARDYAAALARAQAMQETAAADVADAKAIAAKL